MHSFLRVSGDSPETLQKLSFLKIYLPGNLVAFPYLSSDCHTKYSRIRVLTGQDIKICGRNSGIYIVWNMPEYGFSLIRVFLYKNFVLIRENTGLRKTAFWYILHSDKGSWHYIDVSCPYTKICLPDKIAHSWVFHSIDFMIRKVPLKTEYILKSSNAKVAII